MQLHCTPYWPSNMLKILPAFPEMIYSYVKNTRSLRLMFAMIFRNYDMPENLLIIIITIIIIIIIIIIITNIITSSDDIQPSTLLSNQSPSWLIL